MVVQRYQIPTAAGAKALTAQEARELSWFLGALRPDGPSYVCEYRGIQIPATPEMVIRILGWGGRLVYAPRSK